MTPSLKAAQTELKRRLDRIDSMHARALAGLPDGHTWADIDQLEIERCEMALEAHKDFKIAEAEWEAFVAQDNEDSGQEERSYYDDGPSRFEDTPRYRADMIDAGRGRLLR